MGVRMIETHVMYHRGVVSSLFRVQCDTCLRSRRRVGRSMDGLGIRAIRREAVKQGWWCRDRDMCPECLKALAAARAAGKEVV